ncbi:MAG: homoserine kinase [Bacillales bacterium]|jgi:homoserine kinase|nr:homoserine kinase [Bacillales bacterium]
MTKQSVRVRVPASTANLGPGFDTIGMALELYLWVEMSVSDRTTINLIGERVQGLPTDKSNLIYQVAEQVFQVAGVEMPELEISMCSDIPLTRGLGSSASAIVAGMVAANSLLGDKALSKSQLFRLATALEHHPDNVGPSLYGGIIVASWDGQDVHHISINPPSDMEVLAVIPHFELATEDARRALPDSYSKGDTAYNVSRVALLTATLCTGDLSQLKFAMQDRMHQPYRQSLIPGLEELLLHAPDHGALGIALSGAGPTVLAIVDKNSTRKQELEEFMISTFRLNGIDSDAVWLKPDTKGAVIVERDIKLADLPITLSY